MILAERRKELIEMEVMQRQAAAMLSVPEISANVS